MKKFYNSFIKKICIVDRFLMIFMLILLCQSAHTLFSNKIISQGNDTIDIIARTSAASIFGYFLSGSFIKGENHNVKPTQLKNTADITIKSAIGFDASADSDKLQTGVASSSSTKAECSSIQIIIVSVIGIISLLILLALRNFCCLTAEASASVSQLRDFVSASVGFLVGCGKGK